jgi:hypothetical protein
MTPAAAEAIHGLVLWGLVAALAYAMPELTRPELYFAVTVPAEFRRRSEARTALRRYRRRIVRNAGLGLFAIGIGAWRQQAAWFELGALGQIAGQIHAFLLARRAIEPFAVAPSTAREAALTRRPGLPGGVVAQLGPFALLAATAVHVALDAAPPGEPRGYGALVSAALGCGVLLVIARCLAYSSPRIAASGRARHDEQRFRRVTLGLLLGAEYLKAAQACATTLRLPDGSDDAIRAAVQLVTLGLAVIATIAVARLGQGGARHALTAPTGPGDAPVGDGALDVHWKWGLFYVNRDDPAVFVEHRFGIGYTINYGNPRAWGVVALILIATAAAVIAHRC